MSVKRILALMLVLAGALFLGACGSSASTAPKAVITPDIERIPVTAIATTCEVDPVPVTAKPCIPQSAVHPDGYTPAPPPSGFTLTGSQIHLSHNGARFIESFEGFGACPYWDSYGGVWTRGYGETEGIHGGSPCISRSYGERNLIYRAERFYGWSIRGLHTSFNQNQIDALFSFTWNLGAGIFTGSLRYSIEHHNPYPLLGYDHAGGVVLSGLARRRRAEVALFLKPAHEETPAQRRARLQRERTSRLHADYPQRRGLRAVIAYRHCSGGYDHKRRDVKRKCTVWRTHGAQVNRDIRRLRKLGIR